MKTITQKIAEGCGKWQYGYYCGKTKYLKKSGIYLCPTCQATLQAIKECEKINKKEKIKLLDDEINWLRNSETPEEMFFRDDIKERLQALTKQRDELK